jgi:hypothetical protein
VPTVGIYRPPAARRSEEQIAPVPRSSSSTAEIKCERTRLVSVAWKGVSDADVMRNEVLDKYQEGESYVM